MSKTVNGFSKRTKIEKIDWLIENFFDGDQKAKKILSQYWNDNEIIQDLHDDFIENTISNPTRGSGAKGRSRRPINAI